MIARAFRDVWGVFHFQKNPENFHWEFPFGKSAFHLSQVPTGYSMSLRCKLL